MQRLLGVRITRWPLKLAYVVAAGVVAFLLGRALSGLRVEAVAASLVTGLFSLAIYFYGARVFRGRGEAVAPPRPWWQMTARAKLSRRLGILFTIAAALQLLDVGLTLGRHAGAVAFAAQIIETLSGAALAFLYVGSGVRLRKLEATAPDPVPPPPLFEPTEPFVEIPGPSTRYRVSTAGSLTASSGSALLRPSVGASTIDVSVDGHRIGTLDAGALAEPLAHAGAPVRVALLRTGDRLWAEVPTAEAFAAAL